MDETIDLRALVAVLAKGKVLITAITVLAIIIGALSSYFMIDSVYSTNATVSVNSGVNGQKETDYYLINDITPAIYTDSMKDSKVIEQAINKSGVKSYDVGAVQSQLTITQTPNTNLLQLTLQGSNAAEAKIMLDSLIEATKESLLTKILDSMEADKKSYVTQIKTEKENLEDLLKQYQQQVTELGLPASVLMNNVTSSGNPYILNVDRDTTEGLSNLSAEELSVLNELSSKIQVVETVYQEQLTKERQLLSFMNTFNIDNKVLIVSEPIEQESPVSPNPILNMIIALVIGLIAGVGFVFLRHYWQESK